MINVDAVINDTKQKLIDELTEEQINDMRVQIQEQARNFLVTNQEAYVCQWILQNPFLKISDYRLKFVYSDTSHTMYTVEMEKINEL
jgi:hypothetical protein